MSPEIDPWTWAIIALTVVAMIIKWGWLVGGAVADEIRRWRARSR